MHLTPQPSWIFTDKLEGEEIWGDYSDRDDPSGENEERAQLWTEEWETEGKYHSSKSIRSYQNEILNRHKNGDIF